MLQLKHMLCACVKWHKYEFTVSPQMLSEALCSPAKEHIDSINLQTCPMSFSDLRDIQMEMHHREKLLYMVI